MWVANDSEKEVYTISRIMLWSNNRNFCLWVSAKVPQNRCSKRPSATGISTCMVSFKKMSVGSKSGFSFRKKLIQKGVSSMPSKLEMLALKIAAGKFPPATETITTDDETVDGKAARKKAPNQISS